MTDNQRHGKKHRRNDEQAQKNVSSFHIRIVGRDSSQNAPTRPNVRDAWPRATGIRMLTEAAIRLPLHPAGSAAKSLPDSFLNQYLPGSLCHCRVIEP